MNIVFHPTRNLGNLFLAANMSLLFDFESNRPTYLLKNILNQIFKNLIQDVFPFSKAVSD